MHVFFKLPRPVDIPLESEVPFLPPLYAAVFFCAVEFRQLMAYLDTARPQARPAVRTTANSQKVRLHASIRGVRRIALTSRSHQRTWRACCTPLRYVIAA